MDVKFAFLNGELGNVFYIKKPKGFILLENRDYVCKLKKAVYGIKQDPREWFSRLHKYLSSKDIEEGPLTVIYT